MKSLQEQTFRHQGVTVFCLTDWLRQARLLKNLPKKNEDFLSNKESNIEFSFASAILVSLIGRNLSFLKKDSSSEERKISYFPY